MAIVGKQSRQTKPRQRRARLRSAACVYRSEQSTGTVGCKSCGGKRVPRQTYWCAKLTEDVLTHPYRTDMQACSKCSHYVARTE